MQCVTDNYALYASYTDSYTSYKYSKASYTDGRRLQVRQRLLTLSLQ